MASYEILKNQPLVVNLPNDYADQGWIVSDNKGYHSGCNSGYIEKYFDLSSANEWTFKYNVLEYTSGTINIVVNGVSGTVNNSVGEKQDTFTVTGNNVLVRFFSTGTNALEVLQVYAEARYVGGTTLAFNEDADKWVSYFSYVPEFMHKFINSFFTFRNGQMWEHNINETRNNFYGEQFSSKITFYCNVSPTAIKNYHSLREKSNKVWSVTDIEIPAYFGKPNGQKSRLKKGRFKNHMGDFYADFLKDQNDPRFTTQLDALMKGADLQGGIMKLTIENNDVVEVRLLSLELILSLQENTN